MSPELLQELNEIKTRLDQIERAEHVGFIESLTRRLSDSFSIPRRLSDLSDVSDTDGASTGEVLKKTSSTWQPRTDNT
jgi:hypothetical protein